MCTRVTLVGHVLPPEHSVRVVINLETDPSGHFIIIIIPRNNLYLFNYISLHYIVLEHYNKIIQ